MTSRRTVSFGDYSLTIPGTEEGRKIEERFICVLYIEGIMGKVEAEEALKIGRKDFEEILMKYRFPAIKDMSDETFEAMYQSHKK